MSKWVVAMLLTSLFKALPTISAVTKSDPECTATVEKRDALNLSFYRRLNDTDGQWITTFSARSVEAGNSSGTLRLETAHNSVECDGIRTTHVEMTVRDARESHSTTRRVRGDGLVFHHRHGPNIVLFNGGLSAQRKNLEDPFNCAVFSNRPLRDNEMFEVRLEKRRPDKNNCHGIGVMAHSADEIKFHESMYFSAGTWIYYDVNVYGGSKVVVPNYGATVCNTQVGETVGVMKRDNGSVHFFVNGVDQGPAINNAPSVLYGVYEVRGFAAIATIVS